MNRKSLFLLTLTAIIAIVVYRLFDGKFDWSLFLASLWNVHPGWLTAAVVASLLTYVVRAYRWQVLLNPLKFIPIQPLLSTTLIGFTAIYVLGRAGEIVRPVWLTRREQVPLTASFATIIVERFFDSMMLVMLFGWSLLLVNLPIATGSLVNVMKNVAWVMVAGSVGTLAFFSIFRSNIDRIVEYIPFPKVANLLKSFSEGLSFLQQGRSLGMVILHSASLWILIALGFWFMLYGMKFDFSLAASTFILVGAAIGSIAQIPGIGGGFQAGYVFFVTTFFHVPAEQAIATSLVAWAFTYVPTVIVAMLYMIFTGLSWKDLRTATAAH